MIDYDELIRRADYGAARYMRLCKFKVIGDADDVRQQGRLYALKYAESETFNITNVEMRVFYDLCNTGRDAANKAKRPVMILPQSYDTQSFLEDAAADRARDSDVDDMLDGLDEVERQVVLLRMQGYSCADAAKKLRISTRRVGKILKTIQEKFRSFISND